MLHEQLSKLTPEQLAKVETYCTSLLNAKPIDEVERACWNCVYVDNSFLEFPCYDCDTFINFTPKN